MDTGKVQEKWVRISRWYWQAGGVQAPPTLEALNEVSIEWSELYRCRPPEGLKVPILVRQADIEDGITTEAEMETSVKWLKRVRAGVPLGICADELKEWIQ